MGVGSLRVRTRAAHVRFEAGGEAVVQPYTPTNRPGTDELTLTIRRYDDGFASSYMHTRRPGDDVTIGPLKGALTLADADRDVAFLASGTGITPMLAMLRQYLRDGSGNAHIVFGEKRGETIIQRDTERVGRRSPESGRDVHPLRPQLGVDRTDRLRPEPSGRTL
ncbi:ferredoxin--NADP reductase [Natronomonas sp.]|uniref:ferredoxin--NADP reductase n=1 Tax=Natronomonas sp. TaxID=2184060 RepID=UPI0039C95983